MVPGDIGGAFAGVATFILFYSWGRQYCAQRLAGSAISSTHHVSALIWAVADGSCLVLMILSVFMMLNAAYMLSITFLSLGICSLLGAGVGLRRLKKLDKTAKIES